MSKKFITSSDIDSLVEDFGGRKLTISDQKSKREIRKKSSQVDGDDSTDDEKVTESVAKYKIEESWKDFKDNLSSHDYKKPIDEKDLKYSFILHAFGRGVYYSEPVNAIYEVEGGLKPAYLSHNNGSSSVRKTLSQTKFPIDHQDFESEIEYIANRRMTDRSEKRKEKDGILLPKERRDFKSKQWRMPLTNWKFASKESVEVKGVKKMTNTSRDDWTLYQGEDIPYLKKKSSNWVENVATSLSEFPQDDAEQIRALFRGDRIEGNTEKLGKLSFLTNLFFGSETVRSPVGFVSHQMFLDLIGSDQIGFRNWKEAFESGSFPQMGEGAINALRLLNYDYNGSMPYDYRYDANRGFEDERIFKGSPLSPQQQSQQTARSIISAEARIAKSWLALKFPHEPQTPETLMKVLPMQIQEWYRGVDLSNFVPETIQTTEGSAQEEFSPQKPRKLDLELQTIVDIDFNQDHSLFTKDNLIECYNHHFAEVSASDHGILVLREKHKDKLERHLTDDERFICFMLECTDNAGLQINVNREEGFAEIKKDDNLLAICPIQSISTDHTNYKDTITSFVNNHKDKGVKIIFPIHGDSHYKTLAINPDSKSYRYIDPMHDSKDGEIENDGLKSALNEIGYSRYGYPYQKQQYSEIIHKENSRKISHNNECAFHNIYTTIRIAQSQDIGSYLGDMKRYGMTMLGENCKTLTPEFARDNLRPFYEEVFESLRKFIANKKEIPSTSVSPIMSRSASFDGIESKTH